jgi:hypothetical protein
MAVSGNTVEMRISVVDSNSAATVAKVKTELSSLDGEAAKVAASWGMAGAQAEVAGTHMAAGADAGTAGMQKLKNSAGLVRYEFAELGLHAPRYLSSIMASSQALMGVLGAMRGAFIAVGAASMFVSMGKEAKDLYEKYIDLNRVQVEYNEAHEAPR